MNIGKSRLLLIIAVASLIGITQLAAQESPKTKTVETPFGVVTVLADAAPQAAPEAPKAKVIETPFGTVIRPADAAPQAAPEAPKAKVIETPFGTVIRPADAAPQAAPEAPKAKVIETPFGTVIRPADAAPTSANLPASYYRLDIVIKEMQEGKILNSRNYSLWLKTESPRSIGGVLRISNEVPVAAPPVQDVAPSSQGKPARTREKRVSVDLTCRLTEIGSYLELGLSGNISGVIPPEKDKGFPQLYRDLEIVTFAPLTPGKTMTISSVDDPSSNRRFQIDVTANKLK